VSKYREKDHWARAVSSVRFLEQDEQDRPVTPWGPLAEPGVAAPLPHSYWVVEDRLAAGAYPFHGLPEVGERTIAALLAEGITAFVDLTRPQDPSTQDRFAVPYDETLARLSPEARVVSRPIRDMALPTREEAAATLDAIDGLLAEGHAVYVHCLGGLGRTGTVIGCWLVRHRAADSDAVLDVLTGLRASGGRRVPRSPETREQARFVRSWQPGA
jgi:hypothetical protein